jgi:hypothetical protein
VIVASHFGWEIVSPDRPPDYHDVLLMAQLMSEERVGRAVRRASGTSAAQEADRLERLRLHTPE